MRIREKEVYCWYENVKRRREGKEGKKKGKERGRGEGREKET